MVTKKCIFGQGYLIEEKALLEESIKQKIQEVAAVADFLPGVVIIHYVPKMRVEYMSQRGLDLLGVTIDNLRHLEKGYIDRYFNPVDVQYYLPRFIQMLQRNKPGEVMTYFQQVRPSMNDDWEWYLSASHVILSDASNMPILTLTVSQQISTIAHLDKKVDELLEDRLFMQRKQETFDRLTAREIDVLTLICAGDSNDEIMQKLFISLNTVKTHRKVINRKLEIQSRDELLRFGRVFL